MAKSNLFRSDDCGAIVGRLTAEDELKYESYENGNLTMKKVHLTGNIVETDSYDVWVMGKRSDKESKEFDVFKMESIKTDEKAHIYYSEEKEFGLIVIPVKCIKDVDKKVSKSGNLYYEIAVDYKPYERAYLPVSSNTKTSEKGCMIFIFNGKIQKSTTDYAKNKYNRREWTYYRLPFGTQLY